MISITILHAIIQQIHSRRWGDIRCYRSDGRRFGAHALGDRISSHLLEVFKTGSQYQMYHSLALIGIGLLFDKWQDKLLRVSGWLFLAGIVLFSGSLYLLVLLDEPWMGAITPLGGSAFILGWILLAVGIWRSN